MNIRDDGWSDFELQCLYDVINDDDWFEQVEHLIGRRSETAIRVRMSKLRREAEIEPAHRGGRNVHELVERRQLAEAASAKLGAALRALKEDSRPSLILRRREEKRALHKLEAELRPAIEPGAELQLAFLDGPLFDWRPRGTVGGDGCGTGRLAA